MRVLITGGGGQLAHALKREFSGSDLWAPLRTDLDITQFNLLEKASEEFYPDVLINSAALTKVDLCEDIPEQAFITNGIALQKIGELSRKFGFIVVHVSTDYVFRGDKNSPYVEEDCPFPISVYGNSKLIGENLLIANSERYYILRTAGLYGQGGKNFVSFILERAANQERTRVVMDRFSSPTYTVELARQIKLILKNKAPYGIYHATSEGECSWFQFAREILKIKGLDADFLEPVESERFIQKAKRPKYSVLENKKLKELGINAFSYWAKALESYLRQRE